MDRVFKSKAESMTDAQSSESVVESVINTVDTYDFSNYRLDKDSNQAVMDLVKCISDCQDRSRCQGYV